MRRTQSVRSRGSAGTSGAERVAMPSDRPWWAVSVHIDDTGQVMAAAVTTHHVDSEGSFQVVPFGPFDTWEEVLQAIRDSLPIQLVLW